MMQIEQYTTEGYGREQNSISRIIEFYRRYLLSAGWRTRVSSGTPLFVISGLVAAFFVISVLALATAVAGAATIYVPDGGNQTIQQAVDNASEGDEIVVRDAYTGTKENIDIEVPHLTIRSEDGSAQVTVDAFYSGDYIFHVKADYTKITGFTIKNAYQDLYAGIYLDGVNHCDISNNIVIYNCHGIYLFASSENNISGNTANWNENYGIYLYDSEYNTLSSNTVLGNGQGISLISSSTNLIYGNNASNNQQSGITLDSSNGNTISGNTAMKNYVYGISLESSYDNLIYDNYFNNKENGMINAWDYETNSWNISKIPGPNIIGGQYLGGNYWNDYIGEDLDGDGLGDTLLPYNSSGYIMNGGDWSPLVFGDPDTTPPTITDVVVTSITTDSATISWTTDEPSDSLVRYETGSGSNPLTASDATAVISHSLTITGLSAETTYYYVVKSTDQNGNSVESAGSRFTTEAAAQAIIPAEVIIKPKILNLNWNRRFFAFITLPDGYEAANINISTVKCGGAPAIKGWGAHKNKYIVAIFARKDLVGVKPGPKVKLTVTGNLNDGTPFEGSDTIRVIGRGEKKEGDTTKVVIMPETLNLKCKGKITVLITLPSGCKAANIDISTVFCEGAPAVKGWVAHNNKYIAIFETEALVGIEPGPEVELTVTGILEDGTPFEGSDTIRVIEKDIRRR